ncbi:glutamate ABC transporter substrate-binding protein [Rhodococcus sp. NPDC003318]|uniref:glutamate ABC transporter substrate-binding protein n=1 Tax=Rhodococcus sp. NPDC003318 TaxID=3364503 RepID=UPI00369E2E92
MRGSVVALVAVAAVAGCATTSPPAEPAHTVYTDPPLPAGAAVAPPPAESAPPEDCGDPTASLRPLPPSTAAPTPTLDRIRARGRMVVGIDTSSNLFSFRDPATGMIAGFDVDIAREVTRDLLGDPGRIEFRVLSSADRVRALTDRTVDVVVKTMTITCERRTQVAFSTVYFEAQQRVLAMKQSGIRDASDLAGRRVCAAAGTTSLQRIQQVEPEATVLTVPNWADCLVVLQQRQVEAVTSDDSILAGLATQDPNLELVGPSLSSEPYGVGVNLADSDLVRQVNGTLDRIRADGTWQQIHDRWLGTFGPTPPPPTPHYED